MAEYTDKELKEIQKRLMRAYNEICRLERMLKDGDNSAKDNTNDGNKSD